jgi:hypothetical protein
MPLEQTCYLLLRTGDGARRLHPESEFDPFYPRNPRLKTVLFRLFRRDRGDESTRTRHTECLHHCLGFIFGFVIFRSGNGVRNDASTGLNVGLAVF